MIAAIALASASFLRAAAQTTTDVSTDQISFTTARALGHGAGRFAAALVAISAPVRRRRILGGIINEYQRAA